VGQASPRSSGVVMHDNSVGSSYYHSFNVRVQQRLAHGVSLLGTFMRSKMIDQTTWLNDSDATPERRISPFFRPMRFAAASTYEVPIGRGKRINVLLPAALSGAGAVDLRITVDGQTSNPVTLVFQ